MSKLKGIFFTVDSTKENKISTTPVPQEQAVPDEEVLSATLKRYEEELDKLNIPGADFYEFSQAINKINDADPKTYQVIQVTLGLSKKELLDKAQYYIGKLDEFHKIGAKEAGVRAEALLAKQAEESKELHDKSVELGQQIATLQAALNQVNSELDLITGKFNREAALLRNQSNANDTVMVTIAGRIQQVVEGIKQHIN